MADSPESSIQHSMSVQSDIVRGMRPIRPLPKRRIQSRVASSAPDAVPVPSAPEARLFSLPYYQHPSRSISQSSSLDAQASSSVKSEHDEKSRTEGFRIGDADKTGKPAVDHAQGPRTQIPPPTMLTNQQSLHDQDQSWRSVQANPQSLASSADSIDGYDSFENTNNKKKRKIPANGGHHSSLSADLASMELSAIRNTDAPVNEGDGGTCHYYGSGSSAIPSRTGIGVPGAGRARYHRGSARRRSARSPLRVSSNGANYTRTSHLLSKDGIAQENQSPGSSDQAIISAALANASAFPNDTTSQQGKAQLASTSAPDSGRTQFTFSCESDTSKEISWPDYRYQTPASAHTDATPGGNGDMYDGLNAQPSQLVIGASGQGPPATPRGGGGLFSTQRNRRRSLSKQYATAAKDRRVRQRFTNYHHPPKEEDVWICEFCEYEAMFGVPPVALIRQYEIKDRRERKRLAEKQRLLDKAKMKGRRGKKGAKNARQTNSGAQVPPLEQRQDFDMPGMDDYPANQPAMQDEDYLLDEYDEHPLSAASPSAPAQSHMPPPPGHAANTGRPSGSVGLTAST